MGHARAFLGVVAALVAGSGPSAEGVQAAPVLLPEVVLPRVDGGSARVVDGSPGLTAVVFFRAGQDRSAETLRMLGACRPRLEREAVRLVGIVPADSSAAAPALVAASGLLLPVLVDSDDELYAAAAVRTHPAILLVDPARRVVAVERLRQVDACDVLVARVQRVLGKIGDAEVARVLDPPPTRLPGAEPVDVAHRHVALARRLLGERSFARAHENARKALALAASAEAWRVEGQVFAAEGRCRDAVRAFDQALALDPTDTAASSGRRACGR